MWLRKVLSIVPWTALRNSRFISQVPAMAKTISLTKKESNLRQLLLDTATYIGTLDGFTRPELRFTGGWVRDKLLGSTSPDIDIGINTMTGEKFGSLMKEYLTRPEIKSKYDQDVLGGLAKIEANPEKSKHLETITTRILGFDIDLVNLRKETYAEDSRNPTMEFGTPEEDALRRDATVNALFYNLSTAEVEDFTGRGLDDMARKEIKTPLPPLQTFKDDPLRVLRAIRFASRLGYKLHPNDEVVIKENSIIKDALKVKISRERVGVEISKTLKGPDPHTALRLIDDLGLYNAVFTDPTDPDCQAVSTKSWRQAYDELRRFINAKPEGQNNISSLDTIARILLRDSDDVFLAWTLVCYTPWARVTSQPTKPSLKRLPAPATMAAREGIKADNKICKIVDDAALELIEIIGIKRSVCEEVQLQSSPSKRKYSMTSRVFQGQAIRSWGSHWRSNVMYALLVEIAEAETIKGRHDVFEGYSIWLSTLESLNLLDVDRLKPIVNGRQISTALGGAQSGPWMKKALDMTMAWQLRNPDQQDPAGALAEVVEKKNELGIT